MTMTMTDMTSAAAAGHDGAVASGKGPRAGQPKRRSFSAACKARIVQEQSALLAVLDSDRFADKAPAQVHAILLDEGMRLASIRAMHRVMTLADQVRERRAPGRAPAPGPGWSPTAQWRCFRGATHVKM